MSPPQPRRASHTESQQGEMKPPPVKQTLECECVGPRGGLRHWKDSESGCVWAGSGEAPQAEQRRVWKEGNGVSRPSTCSLVHRFPDKEPEQMCTAIRVKVDSRGVSRAHSIWDPGRQEGLPWSIFRPLPSAEGRRHGPWPTLPGLMPKC